MWECVNAADLAQIDVAVAKEKDWAFVADTCGLYQLISGVWVLRFSDSGNTTIITDITSNGTPIGVGYYVFNVGADSTHAIDSALLTKGSRIRLYQEQDFTATITLPAGWSFSTGEQTIPLGYNANCCLFFIRTGTAIIEYNSPGKTS
jgi:hypothetical protein